VKRAVSSTRTRTTQLNANKDDGRRYAAPWQFGSCQTAVSKGRQPRRGGNWDETDVDSVTDDLADAMRPVHNPACERRKQTGREAEGRVPKGHNAAGGRHAVIELLTGTIGQDPQTSLMWRCQGQVLFGAAGSPYGAPLKGPAAEAAKGRAGTIQRDSGLGWPGGLM